MKTRTALVLAISLILAGLLFFAIRYINGGITINDRGTPVFIDLYGMVGFPLLLAGFLILLVLFLSWFGKWADAHSQMQKS
jgi:hypothetical protein